MSFFERISTGLNAIQRIATKYCPECKKEMYLARWVGVWSCEDCEIALEFTPEERDLINKFESERGLTRTGRKKK